MEVDARQTERRRYQGSRGAAIGTEGLPVHEKFGVKFAGAPTAEDGMDGGLIDAQQIGNRLKVGRETDNRADVQVAIWPAIETMPNARRKCVIDRGMAQRALNAHALQRAVRVEDSGYANHGVQLQQSERNRGIIQIYLACLDLLHQGSRKRVLV